VHSALAPARTRSKLLSITVGQTALVWHLTFTSNPLQAMVMTYSNANAWL